MDLVTLCVVVLVFILGVPHGAFDPVIARQVGLTQTRLATISFYSAYLALVLMVYALWLKAPLISLAVFLIISALHFGREREKLVLMGGFPFGAMVIGLIALCDADRVNELLSLISMQQDVEILVSALQLFGILGASIVMYQGIRSRQFILLSELMGLLILAFVFDPLIYFALYFCVLHSPRHIKEVWRFLPVEDQKRALMSAVGVMIATLVLSVFGYMSYETAHPVSDKLIFLMFVGLAALTYPHMALTEYVRFKRAQG